jgi:galactokinase
MTAARAPGRVNLMGDHTDYNEGFVLPLAIELECVVRAEPAADGVVRIQSLDLDPGATVTVAADGSDEPASVSPAWGRYAAGVVRALAERGRPAVGLDAVVSTTVPLGAGLSSSAAFEVSLALALCDVAGFALPRVDLAQACRRAEEIATGVPCGIMDQLTSLSGQSGHALLIDCRSLDVRPIRLPAGIAVLVVHSGVARALADGAYAERRRDCEEVAARLGLPALRDATPEQVADDHRARHVVSENARVLEAAQAFETGDVEALGPLMAASHASLRDDFEVSTPELDALVDALVEAGAIGARLTGAGFGGCVVALATLEQATRVVQRAVARYGERTGLESAAFTCRAVDGAGLVAAKDASVARTRPLAATFRRIDTQLRNWQGS